MSYTACLLQVARRGLQVDVCETSRQIHLRMLAGALIAGNY